MIPPLHKCDLPSLILLERPEHPPHCLTVPLHHSLMYVLILVSILERWVLCDKRLEELQQLPLEVGLSAGGPPLLRVAADDPQGSPVLQVASQSHIVLLDHLLNEVVLRVSDNTQS
jgi:hypothetical protein